MKGKKMVQRSIKEHIHRKKNYFFWKRMFDLFFSILGILVLFPIGLIVGILIALTSKGSPLFIQNRAGKNGKIFRIVKFRTMVQGAESIGERMTIGDDPRIHPVGRFLRKFKMDEIPQLLNVLKGDMSFVGPRPLVPEHINLYTKTQQEVLLVKPGITDLASITFRKESEMLARSEDPLKTYVEEIIPRKVELNKEYIAKMSIPYDIWLILKTLFSLFKL